MRPTVKDRVAWSVCRSVCLSVCHTSEPCKTAEPIEMPFGTWTRPREPYRWGDGGAYWRDLANTFELPISGGDAALLSNYFGHLLLALVERIKSYRV